MNFTALSTLVLEVWEDSIDEDVTGRATSMGANGRNPKHT
jgi:hypothetical protein